jgi:hypothetical protein
VAERDPLGEIEPESQARRSRAHREAFEEARHDVGRNPGPFVEHVDGADLSTFGARFCDDDRDLSAARRVTNGIGDDVFEALTDAVRVRPNNHLLHARHMDFLARRGEGFADIGSQRP